MMKPVSPPPSPTPTRAAGSAPGAFDQTADRPDQVGPYRLERAIGRGGQATVYRGLHVELERLAAVKLLAPKLADDDEYTERFHREATLSARLDHPNIVSVYASGVEAGWHWLAMELVDGEPVSSLIARKGKLPTARAFAIAVDVASALDYAVRRGVLHRDVKPQNVLLGATDPRARLADLGLAKDRKVDRRLTETGIVLGTPRYMAPEVILEGKSDDVRADIYSLGLMLFEMLTGQVPLTDPTSAFATMMRHTQEDVPPPSSLEPRLSPTVDVVLGAMTARDPAGRYPNAAELARDLEAVGRGEAPSRLPPPAPARAEEPIAAAVEAEGPPPSAPPGKARPGDATAISRVRVALVAVAVGFLGVAVALGLVLGLGEDPLGPPPKPTTPDRNTAATARSAAPSAADAPEAEPGPAPDREAFALPPPPDTAGRPPSSAEIQRAVQVFRKRVPDLDVLERALAARADLDPVDRLAYWTIAALAHAGIGDRVGYDRAVARAREHAGPGGFPASRDTAFWTTVERLPEVIASLLDGDATVDLTDELRQAILLLTPSGSVLVHEALVRRQLVRTLRADAANLAPLRGQIRSLADVQRPLRGLAADGDPFVGRLVDLIDELRAIFPAPPSPGLVIDPASALGRTILEPDPPGEWEVVEDGLRPTRRSDPLRQLTNGAFSISIPSALRFGAVELDLATRHAAVARIDIADAASVYLAADERGIRAERVRRGLAGARPLPTERKVQLVISMRSTPTGLTRITLTADGEELLDVVGSPGSRGLRLFANSGTTVHAVRLQPR